MKTFAIGRWVLECDPDATRSIYEASSHGAHVCSCAYCRNFIAVRDEAYPSEFLELLAALGIDPHKEADIAEFGEEGAGRLYQGWYHFIGRVVEDHEDQMTLSDSGTVWSVFFSASRSLALSKFGDEPLVQLDWSVTLPWVLAEAPESSAGV